MHEHINTQDATGTKRFSADPIGICTVRLDQVNALLPEVEGNCQRCFYMVLYLQREMSDDLSYDV